MVSKLSSQRYPAFVPAGPKDSRAPCPALNSLANHGYLPHNGREIGFWKLTQAMRNVYSLSLPFAAFLSFVGMMTCGHGLFRMKLNLDDLAAHNKIEHDASLSRADAAPGQLMAPIPIDQKRFQTFLGFAALSKGLFIEDFVQARVFIEKQSKPLDDIHAQVAQGEVAAAWFVMRDEEGKIPLDRLKQWWGEERLPDGWKKPKTIGLIETRTKANEVASIMKKMKQ